MVDRRQLRLGHRPPDSPGEEPPSNFILDKLTPAVASLGLPFVSVDLAHTADGEHLRIVELGDGQVSDRPTSSDPAAFITAIAQN